MTKEALKLALEVLKAAYVPADLDDQREKAIAALEALMSVPDGAQPEQEPVAHINQNGVIHEAGYPWGPNNDITPLYTTPPQRTWVGLTDEDISEIVRGTHNTGSFVRAIEAKLKEKNT